MSWKGGNPRKQYRLRLSEEEKKLIEGYRKRLKDEGLDAKDVKHFWSKSKNISAFVNNPEYVPREIKQFKAMSSDLVDEVKKYAPKYPKLKRKQYKRPHALVVDPADIHIGKLCSAFETGEDYNQQIAVQRVLDGVSGIVQKCQYYDVDQIIFIGGNDILHIDTPKRTTTSGTPQDTDGMWYENFMNAKSLYIDLMEKLLTIAPVHFVYCPSNHDYISSFMLAQVIDAWFSKVKDVTFDISAAHRKYFAYGKNLLGFTHGDGAKERDLPILMAQEAPVEWSKTKHRYVYTHHVHHKTAKDYVGVTVESLRSPSGSDSWHHRNGYQHNPKAVEGFLHDPLHGQIARITHLF